VGTFLRTVDLTWAPALAILPYPLTPDPYGGIGSTRTWYRRRGQVKFGANDEIRANVYVPNGTLLLSKNGHLVGAFIARWIEVGINAEVEHQSQWTEVSDR